MEELLKEQPEEGKQKGKKKSAEKEELKEDSSEALFQELLNSPLSFTLDQLLSLVRMFRDRVYSAVKKSSMKCIKLSMMKQFSGYNQIPISPEEDVV